MKNTPIDRIIALLPLLHAEDLVQLGAAVQLLVVKIPGREDPYTNGCLDTLLAMKTTVQSAIQEGALLKEHTDVMMALIDATEQDIRQMAEAERIIGLATMKAAN